MLRQMCVYHRVLDITDSCWLQHMCRLWTDALKCCPGNGNFPADDCIPDPINGAKYVRDLYEKVHDTAGDLHAFLLTQNQPFLVQH